jgi:glycosyltransferase involved in cell wall biosynthesis
MFSVVMPLYNKEKSIKNAIQSVLAQTVPYFELLVINDGSTDESIKIVTSIPDKRIKIITKSNGGVSSARNKGILSAGYEYIAFIDADDHWEPDFLKSIEDLIHEYPDAGAYGTAYKCMFDNKILNLFSAKKRGLITDFFKQVYEGPILHASSVCIKKKTFEDIGYFDERVRRGEDYDMWARIAIGSSIAVSTDPKVWYRLDAENRAMESLPEPSVLWLYYIRKEDIADSTQRKYYQRFLHRQVFAYLFKGKYKWAWQMASQKWSIATWYSYLYVPNYIQLRQLKTFRHMMRIWIGNLKKFF